MVQITASSGINYISLYLLKYIISK